MIKPPYNINAATQELALNALDNIQQVNAWTKETVSFRDALTEALSKIEIVLQVYPSDANFILVKVTEPREIYNYLVGQGIIVRDRSKIILCEGCLRMTIGTESENLKLINLTYCKLVV